ncbi:GNAT family N-acetyltransferase [Sneathiella glossodoripedis]|uniref:GNAT family N-acetyltransferase n=1 Tax=Sneathiella glossodoripedis TaxID=418853 RepID=UPI000684617A|nr:GNAT family N-acetyltransferase [Sneathiella glossodoripedis]
MAIKTKALFPPVRSFLYIEEMKVHDNHPAKDPQVLSLHRLCFPTDSEARLVEQLHLDGDASLSLAATVSETLIGHVLFSQMKAPFRALALAPVAVTPEYRCRGIAAKLIETGIHKATKEAGREFSS